MHTQSVNTHMKVKKMKVQSLSRVRLFATPWTVAYQAPQFMDFSRQEYWTGLPFPSPRDLPYPGINPGLPHCGQTLYHLHMCIHICIHNKHTQTYTYIQVYTCTHIIHTQVYTHTHAYTKYAHICTIHTYTYTQAHTCTHMHTQNTHIHVHIYTSIHKDTHTNTHTHTSIYMHTHTHTRIHIHKCTHVHTQATVTHIHTHTLDHIILIYLLLSLSPCLICSQYSQMRI